MPALVFANTPPARWLAVRLVSDQRTGVEAHAGFHAARNWLSGDLASVSQVRTRRSMEARKYLGRDTAEKTYWPLGVTEK